MIDKYSISSDLLIPWKRICSLGNRGHQNFGDELILIGLIRLLLRSIDHPSLIVGWWNISFLQKFHRYFFTAKELSYLSYLQEIPHWFRSFFYFLTKTPRDFFSYLHCDTFILGWWELFTEETPGSYLYRRRSLLPFWIRRFFGYQSSLYLMWWVQLPSRWHNKLILKHIVRSSSGSFCRDEESVDVVRSLLPFGNKEHEKHRWYIDTSYFALWEGWWEDNQKSRVGWGRDDDKESPHSIVNASPLSPSWTKSLEGIIASQLDQWYTVYFLPAFFTSNPQQDDIVVYKNLQKLFPSLQLLDWRERDSFIQCFTSAKHIYCSRLHIFLVAAFLWLPVTPYAYQKKINKNISILKKTWIVK